MKIDTRIKNYVARERQRDFENFLKYISKYKSKRHRQKKIFCKKRCEQTRKIKFRTKQMAIQRIFEIDPQRYLRAYFCNFCQGWHLTKTFLKKKDKN